MWNLARERRECPQKGICAVRPCAILFALTAVIGVATAQDFIAEDGAFVWKQGDEYVRFDRGRWSAGIEGGRSVSFHTFLWHDRWVYETLHGGTVEAGPTLQEDGSITMSGTFSARDWQPAPTARVSWQRPLV